MEGTAQREGMCRAAVKHLRKVKAGAVAHAREVLQRNQDFTVSGYLPALHYQQPSDIEHVRGGLLKAGLPG